MYINPITAWVICSEFLKPDDVLLVNACGSSIGHIFTQLSKVVGFRLIAVTRNDRYTEDLLQLGASDVIDTSKVSLRETVMELTNGMGADAAIDSVGGGDGTNLAFSLKPNGKFIMIGLLSGKQVDWKYITRKTKVKANIFHLRNWNKSVSINNWHESFHHLIELIVDKKLHLKQGDAKYDLLNIMKAMDVVESSKLINGKVFLTNSFL